MYSERSLLPNIAAGLVLSIVERRFVQINQLDFQYVMHLEETLPLNYLFKNPR